MNLISCSMMALLLALLACVVVAADDHKNNIKWPERIVGGSEVSSFASYSYQVFLQVNGGQFCGGSVIDARHVLTAAHCLYDTGTREYLFGLPTSSLTIGVGLDKENPTQTVTAASFKVHPSYDGSGPAVERIDFAIITLTEDLSPSSIPCSFPDWPNPWLYKSGKTSTVSGYGTTNGGGNGASSSNPSRFLKTVDVPIVDSLKCRARAEANNALFPVNVFCAGGQFGQDSCQGDSGGPIIVVDGATRWQIGVVQSGTVVSTATTPLCGGAGEYGIYTHVGKTYTWMASQVASLPAAEPAKVWEGSYATVTACSGCSCCINSIAMEYTDVSGTQLSITGTSACGAISATTTLASKGSTTGTFVHQGQTFTMTYSDSTVNLPTLEIRDEANCKAFDGRCDSGFCSPAGRVSAMAGGNQAMLCAMTAATALYVAA